MTRREAIKLCIAGTVGALALGGGLIGGTELINNRRMKKLVIINASPRKNKNTATLLKEAQRGAESLGAEVEFVNLVDLTFKGCMSCFACKRKGNTCNGLCAWKDDLRPVLEKILAADALVVGSPIYWSNPTGMFRNLIERLLFPMLRYDLDEKTGYTKKYFDKKMPTALVYTMNVTPEAYVKMNYDAILGPDKEHMEYYFGSCEVLRAHNTWQFPDYDKYDSSAVDVELKKWYRENQWPKDMEAAFELGKRLVNQIVQ